ncbi:hypothetical protein MMC13_002254 [Lambiella insularis]|nr:hypothetical protein [Lambiella insularis]
MRYIIIISFVLFNASIALSILTSKPAAVTRATTPAIKAIVPTASGQIGVNPVSVYQITTKWIGVNTVSVQTITSAGKVATVTPPWEVVTATNGDLSFPISPSGRKALTTLFKEVAAACGGTKKVANGAMHLLKRVGQCELNYLSRPGVGGGALEFDMPSLFGTITAGDVSVALQSTPAAVAVAFLAYLIGDGVPPADEAPKIPASNVAKPTKTTHTSTSKSQSPVPTTTLDDQPDSIYTGSDEVYTSIAQAILARIASDAMDTLFESAPTPTASAPWCLHGGSPHGNRYPQEYCQCGKSYASLYSIATSTTNPCPWTTAPGPTLTFVTWTAQSHDGKTCSFPSTMSCLTYNHANHAMGSHPTPAPRKDGSPQRDSFPQKVLQHPHASSTKEA